MDSNKGYIDYRNDGWVQFRRCYCKEGFIDIWTGDAINNPNNENKSHLALNASATYYRLNGEGEWIRSLMCSESPSMWVSLNRYYQKFSAQDIWDYVFRKRFAI